MSLNSTSGELICSCDKVTNLNCVYHLGAKIRLFMEDRRKAALQPLKHIVMEETKEQQGLVRLYKKAGEFFNSPAQRSGRDSNPRPHA